MLAIETYIQNSVSSVSGKVCAVVRLVAFASIATSFDLDSSSAVGIGSGPVGPVLSEPIKIDDEDQAKQLDYWHQHDA